MKTLYFLLAGLLTMAVSCKTDTSPKQDLPGHITQLSPQRDSLNISILLDLSDRINPEKHPAPAMEFHERDLGYIHSVTEALENHLMNKKTQTIDDRIQLFIDPLPADKTLNQKMVALKMGFNKANATREKILSITTTYDSLVPSIYEATISQNQYVGSDIWRFLTAKASDYCISKSHRNLLIILTDGYLYHENTRKKDGNRTSYLLPKTIRANQLAGPDWKERFESHDYGFLNGKTDLSALEILVVGINPYPQNQNDEAVMTLYWTQWFQEMGVSKFELKRTDLPSHMDKIIKDFVLMK
jgi:hypothetical protein